jgi:GT2 family glycosyltransferase
MYEISCSIVLFNNPPEELRKAVYSFIEASTAIRLFLVDNSPEDGLRYEFDHPHIEYIFNGRNIGFGAAHNLAIKKVQGISKYHLILNPDVEFHPGIITELVRFMEQRPGVGLVMPKVLYQDGEMQYLCKKLPSPADLFVRRFIPALFKRVFRKYLETYELKHKDYNAVMEIPNLSGCFMFIRTKVFSEVGLFDEQYFLYCEDMDLCRRINERYHTVYYPKVSIIHAYRRGSYKSRLLMQHHIKSAIRYFNKWGWFNDAHRIAINNAVLNNMAGRRSISPRVLPGAHVLTKTFHLEEQPALYAD